MGRGGQGCARHRRGACRPRGPDGPSRSRRHDRLRQGRTPSRDDTCSVSKFAEIFRRRRYCHEAGGWFGFDPGTSY
nr:MAG TPA: hypothetical protein [Caudoviricetes sp.]